MTELNDFGDITKTLNFLHPNGSTFEVCCIGPRKRRLKIWGDDHAGGKKPIVAGWFTDHGTAAKTISKLDQLAEPEGIYVSLNQCNPALIARANNRLKTNVGRTQDIDIEHLENLLIDVDPKRPAGISATEGEKNGAVSAIKSIWHDLKNRGWPDPLRGDSGNGEHLIYKIDLPNTEENVQLIKDVLVALDQKHSTDAVEIDTKVFNPARLCKVYGTIARKGDRTDDRPYRKAKILCVPEDPKPVDVDLLKSLAAEATEHFQANYSNIPISSSRHLDVATYLDRHGVEVVNVKKHGSSTLYCLRHCVFDESHTSNEASIGQTSSGKLFYQCFHNSCKKKTWHDARRKISGDDPLFECSQEYKEISKATTVQNRIDPPKLFLPMPDRFPIDVLPDAYALIVTQAAKAFAVPLEVPACALLSMSGACIGRTRGLTIKDGWREFANLYIGIVAESGIGKSPCTKAIFEPIFRVEKKWFDEYQTASLQYDEEMGARQNSESRDDLAPPPDAPLWKQLFVDDTTVESLTDALQGNPRGILWYRDELSGLILELDKYSGKDGGTKARLMSAYDCGVWKTNRIKKGRVNLIQHACLSIFGTIQPRVLPRIFSDLDAATGFLPRFLFVRASQENPPVWTNESFGNEYTVKLGHLVHELLGMDFLSNGESRFVDVTPDAKSLFIDWHNQQVCEPWVDFDSQAFVALSAKLRGQCLRICLILHCLRSVEAERSEFEPVSADTMKKAIKLADWFKVHQRQVWQIIGNASQVAEFNPIERRVAIAIVALESEIQNEAIPTARVTAKINENASWQYQVSANTVGRACSALGLGHKRTSEHRMIVITQKRMQEIKSSIRNVTNVTNVIETQIAAVREDDIRNHNVTNVTLENDICDSKKKDVIAVKPHQLLINDISDISDVAMKKIMQPHAMTRLDEVEI